MLFNVEQWNFTATEDGEADIVVLIESKYFAPDIRERLVSTGLTFIGKLLRQRVGDNRRVTGDLGVLCMTVQTKASL